MVTATATRERAPFTLRRNYRAVDVYDVAIELRDRIRKSPKSRFALFVLPDGAVHMMPKHGARFDGFSYMYGPSLVGVYTEDAHAHEIIEDVHTILSERGR